MSQFDEVTAYFSDDIKNVLNNISPAIKEKICEIRIRSGKPLVVVIRNKSFFVSNSSLLIEKCSNTVFVAKKTSLEDSFSRLCDYSFHTHISTMVDGFITLKNGCRVGIASSAVIKDNKISSIKDVTSINVRIAKEFKGVSRPILNTLFINSPKSIIIAGPPGCGKTTVLRDIASELSSGFKGEYKKVAVVDERGELFSEGRLDVGKNTDVLSYFPKRKGIEIAIRTLSPEIIICDEIGTDDEVNQIEYGFSSGIKYILSIHAEMKDDILLKPHFLRLIESGEFSYVVFLNNSNNEFEIIDCEDVMNEVSGSYFDNNLLFPDGSDFR